MKGISVILEAVNVGQQRVYGRSLDLPLNFATNVKTVFKNWRLYINNMLCALLIKTDVYNFLKSGFFKNKDSYILEKIMKGEGLECISQMLLSEIIIVKKN